MRSARLVSTKKPVPMRDRDHGMQRIDGLDRQLLVEQICQRIDYDTSRSALQKGPDQHIGSQANLSGPLQAGPPHSGQPGVARTALPPDTRELRNRL
jgi:hypothetical protein